MMIKIQSRRKKVVNKNIKDCRSCKENIKWKSRKDKKENKRCLRNKRKN